jgi:hypothetical protein
MGLGLGACRVLVPLALFGLVTENAEAQTCTIGKRCGNTCISALDTCHLNGDGSGLSDEEIVAVSVAAGVALVGLIVWWRLASSEFLYPGEAVAAKGLQPDGRIVVRSSTKGLIVVTNTLRGGLDPGDQLVAIDNFPIHYFDDVVKAQERPPVFREGYRVRVRTQIRSIVGLGPDSTATRGHQPGGSCDNHTASLGWRLCQRRCRPRRRSLDSLVAPQAWTVSVDPK